MHSFVSCLMHVVFSTKDRYPWITDETQERLWPYLGGIARENKMKAIEVGGVEDHVHMLISLPSTLAIAKAVQLIKGNFSKWIHETFPALQSFEWQEGYGAFSIGISGVDEHGRLHSKSGGASSKTIVPGGAGSLSEKTRHGIRGLDAGLIWMGIRDLSRRLVEPW